MIRINVGCGQTPTKGWRNFDNSLSLRLAKSPLFAKLLRNIGLIDLPQWQFILFARANGIEYGDSTGQLPLADGSVEILYSSHMLEHLDRTEAVSFLMEARRLLVPGGVIRLAVPDLGRLVGAYSRDGDADAFLELTGLCVPQSRSFSQRLRLLVTGQRHHLWMYDGPSLCTLLARHGFVDPRVLPPGQTSIRDNHSLDLFERARDSVYVEAIAPGGHS
jgi:hypothetical protein